MADERATPWVELWRYPLAVLSIFVALVGAKYILGIPFGSVAEITKDGIKFREEAKGELASLSAQLNAATRAIEEIKRQIPEKPLTPAARSDIFEASQTVSAQTAQVASLDAPSATGPALKGYLWMGDYDRKTKTWSRVKLVSPGTNAPLANAPDTVAPGSVWAVSGNMVLRDGLPANNAEYFQARKSLGVLPVGTKVVVQAAPVAIDREFAVQYWLEVAAQR